MIIYSQKGMKISWQPLPTSVYSFSLRSEVDPVEIRKHMSAASVDVCVGILR